MTITGGAAELLAGLAVPAVLVRDDGNLAMVNLAAETFLNASQAQLTERGWAAAFGPDSAVEGLVWRARRDGGGCAAYDLPLVIAGRPARADVLVAPVAELPGWQTVAFQTRSVATLVDRQVQHQGAARSAVGIAAMLAHEIKNPLSGIRGAAQLLSAGLDADGQELTGLIVTEVDRIAKLVDRMESFTDTRPMRLKPENIHEVLGHARRVAEQGFARGITIKERYDPSLPLISANRDAMIQVFLNLLKNAAEAVDEMGTISLTTAFKPGLKVRNADGGKPISLPLEVRIIDSGPGIPEGLAPHIFEPFVGTKRGGSGLGLALVAKIVADHGGIIEYERSGEPEATVFRILLPVAS